MITVPMSINVNSPWRIMVMSVLLTAQSAIRFTLINIPVLKAEYSQLDFAPAISEFLNIDLLTY